MTEPGSAPQFQRFVAIGDSTTEGLDDPHPDGGYRGWADRLAERLAVDNPAVLYANLAIRGRLIARVREEQLEPAVAMAPDLASVVAGTNDLLRPKVDIDAVAEHMEAMLTALGRGGATLMTFTIPDLSPVMPVARLVRSRLLAYNDSMRAVARRTGAVLLDVADGPIGVDARFLSTDRLHANGDGHARIAAGAATALGLPPIDARWADPLPPGPARRRHQAVVAELDWSRRHLAPWISRRARGRSSGDAVVPKRPALEPVVPRAVA